MKSSEADGAGEPSPATAQPAQRMRPRDAATLLIVDSSSGTPRLLMGRRRPDLVFMPNMFVFPGGRSEPDDRRMAANAELPERDVDRLLHDMKGHVSPARARGLALAALRETFEEAGVLIGRRIRDDECEEVAGQVGSMHPWHGFLSEGVLPCLSNLRFLARAITPPGRPRRFDTRFFTVDASHIAKQVAPPDDELHDLSWHTLEDVRGLELPNITRAVVEDLSERLENGRLSGQDKPVPYYYFRRNAFQRELIA